ncbi:hypothetical protein B0J14DRAFT_658637 [Halenospora varia]|nr:hypothetical protein B0J14DRAFT_658637 [Halenospora varia]
MQFLATTLAALVGFFAIAQGVAMPPLEAAVCPYVVYPVVDMQAVEVTIAVLYNLFHFLAILRLQSTDDRGMGRAGQAAIVQSINSTASSVVAFAAIELGAESMAGQMCKGIAGALEAGGM